MLDGVAHEAGDGVDVGLAVDAAAVVFDGLGREVQPPCALLAQEALAEHLGDFHFVAG